MRSSPLQLPGAPVCRIVDIGGQRNERKKLIHILGELDIALFCVALSEYDQMLFEDITTNRMEEAVGLWREFTASRWFASPHIARVIVFTKSDAFRNKIAAVPLSVCWPELKAPPVPDPSDSAAFERFVASQIDIVRGEFLAAEPAVTAGGQQRPTQFITVNLTTADSPEFAAFVQRLSAEVVATAARKSAASLDS
jgi:hypothetical protein